MTLKPHADERTAKCYRQSFRIIYGKWCFDSVQDFAYSKARGTKRYTPERRNLKGIQTAAYSVRRDQSETVWVRTSTPRRTPVDPCGWGCVELAVSRSSFKHVLDVILLAQQDFNAQLLLLLESQTCFTLIK